MEVNSAVSNQSPYRWVPSLYFFQGMPFALVNVVAAIMYKNLGISNVHIAFYTSLFILPWILKPIFSPLLEIIASKKTLTVTMQLILAVSVFFLGISLVCSHFFACSLISFFFIAFASSLHDIASDGMYLLNLSTQQQAYFIGVRTFFYQAARFFCQGGLIIIAGLLQPIFGMIPAWQMVYESAALLLIMLTVYHYQYLPQRENHFERTLEFSEILKTIFSIVKAFLKLPHIKQLSIFLLVYNLMEAQLIKISPLFLLDKISLGGLQKSAVFVGTTLGGFGVTAMIIGVMISGMLIAKYSLQRCLVPVTLITLVINSGYLFLSLTQTHSAALITLVIVLTQFVFGLSNAAYMTYLLYAVRSEKYQMTFYAIGTALMSFGMMLPGALSGYIQHMLGYNGFFIWILMVGLGVLLYTKKIVALV